MKISQREARRLRKRVNELEVLENSRRWTWVSEWPCGTFIASINVMGIDNHAPEIIATARKLKHAVVASVENREVRFYALPLKGQ